MLLVILASDDEQINHEVCDREVARVVAQLPQVAVPCKCLVHRAKSDAEGQLPLPMPWSVVGVHENEGAHDGPMVDGEAGRFVQNVSVSPLHGV